MAGLLEVCSERWELGREHVNMDRITMLIVALLISMHHGFSSANARFLDSLGDWENLRGILPKGGDMLN